MTSSIAAPRTIDDLIELRDVAAIVAVGGRPAAPVFAPDLYRDIHKGIRAELFDLTSAAGSLDPFDDIGRGALAAHVAAVAEVLATHAAHEDAFVDPALVQVDAELSARVEAEHHELEAAFAVVASGANLLVGAEVHQRRGQLQLLHLQLSGFTSAYLRHQLVEERVIMPLLADALGPEGVAEIHAGIIASIPPEEMARSLAFMLPAMNADDRAELLGAMRAEAPPEAFAQVLDLARSVLAPAELAATRARLGL
ncbi:MAG: hemerythrin domain-containing protein [Acidimicrobiales bacterium]